MPPKTTPDHFNLVVFFRNVTLFNVSDITRLVLFPQLQINGASWTISAGLNKAWFGVMGWKERRKG